MDVRSPSPAVKQEPSREPSLPAELPHLDVKGKMKELSASYDADGDIKMEEAVKPLVDSKPSFASPPTPQTIHQLPPKPDWSRADDRAVPTAPHQAPSVVTKAKEVTPENVVPEPKIPEWVPDKDEEHERLMHTITRLRETRTKQAKDHDALQRSTDRALHELKLASHELKFAEKRRTIADAQLEKARAGILGMDYSRKVESTATRLATTSTA